MEHLVEYLTELIKNNFPCSIPYLRLIDVIQILILTVVVYNMILWLRSTRAWNLLKGIVVLLLFYVVAVACNMSVILWIVNNCLSLLIMAAVVVFQPELRRALERLGDISHKNKLFSWIPFNVGDNVEKEQFTRETAMEILNATFAMSAEKTGALIVIQQNIALEKYVQRWGTNIDALVGSELLLNIFEKDTPLHDGAVIIIGNRIAAAKCFLPLNETEGVSAKLGTRHHAAAGISEVTDSITVIVSEQTGKVSVTKGGNIRTNLDRKALEKELLSLCNENKPEEVKKSKHGIIGRKLKKDNDEKKCDR